MCALCGDVLRANEAVCEACQSMVHGDFTMRQWLTSILFQPFLPTIRSMSFVHVEDDINNDINDVEHVFFSLFLEDAGPAGNEALNESVFDVLLVPCECSGACSVCLEEMEDEVCVRLPCAHCFHRACVKPWLLTHDSCPLCRDSLNNRFEQSKPGFQLEITICCSR